ncbi:MAG: alanine--glyoxylate aminotransferase family protein [Mailhella sp.]|nr:alanine--glyoxylate aminotransferase family protein [Mailhella sp.]
MSFQATRMLTPGPTPIPDRVRLAMAAPLPHHRKDAFKQIMAENQAMLRQLFCTEGPVIPLASSGTGSMTAAAFNLFEPGEKVLVATAGYFGNRWLDIVKMRGLDPVVLRREAGQSIEAEDIRAALDADPAIRGVFMQISETSTGVLHPIQDVAAVTRDRNVLLVADGISAVSISPVRMDEWGIDCLLTGSQKGLMLPPGLAFIALSPRAWARAEQISPNCYYFDLVGERTQCAKNQTHYTSPISLLVGLNEALKMLFEFGMDNVFKKQRALTCMARAGIKAMGLEPMVKDEKRCTWGLTSIRLPDDMQASPIIANAYKEWGVILTAGQADLKEKVVRLAHMGWVDWADITAALHALAYSLPEKPQGAYLEAALAAYHKALAE